MTINIPFNYEARDYQRNFWYAFNTRRETGQNRFMKVWHRRCGKDKTDLNATVQEMFEEVGNYAYFFPTYKQAKKVIWNGIDNNGFKFMDHIPEQVRKRTDNTDLFIEAVNGSTFQLIGSDNIDSIVGTNFKGCVFAEYSLQNPLSWDYMRPILAANGGWAIFNFTFRGENHAFELYEYVQSLLDKYSKQNKIPNWWCELLTVDDTKFISQDVLDQERDEIIAQNGDDALFQQEYYCNPHGAINGAYFFKWIKEAQEQGRMRSNLYDPNLKVRTYWDLGINDAMAITFVQVSGGEFRAIDYYEGTGKGFDHYAKVVKEKGEKLGYVYEKHVAPHDINVRDLMTGKTRIQIAEDEYDILFDLQPRMKRKQDGIDAARHILPRCFFDKDTCKQLIRCLKNYHKKFDDMKKTFLDHPEHDWSSNGADSFQYTAIDLEPIIAEKPSITEKKKIEAYNKQKDTIRARMALEPPVVEIQEGATFF